MSADRQRGRADSAAADDRRGTPRALSRKDRQHARVPDDGPRQTCRLSRPRPGAVKVRSSFSACPRPASRRRPTGSARPTRARAGREGRRRAPRANGRPRARPNSTSIVSPAVHLDRQLLDVSPLGSTTLARYKPGSSAIAVPGLRLQDVAQVAIAHLDDRADLGRHGGDGERHGPAHDTVTTTGAGSAVAGRAAVWRATYGGRSRAGRCTTATV